MVEKPLDMKAGDTLKSEKVCLPRKFAHKVPKKVCRESFPRKCNIAALGSSCCRCNWEKDLLPTDVPQFPHPIKIYMFDIIKVKSQDESQIYCQDEYIKMRIKINVASFGALTGTWPSVCPPG